MRYFEEDSLKRWAYVVDEDNGNIFNAVPGVKEVFLKQCCGIAPAIWKDNQWNCSECDKPVGYVEQQLEFGSVTTLLPKGAKICDCGGEKAKTTHANWCSKGNG